MAESNGNPWLSITASDYEQHMDMVGQLSVLNGLFAEAVRDLNPKSLLVLGCGTGNGFEHIDSSSLSSLVGIDLNPEYLAELGERFSDRYPFLKTVCADIAEADLGGMRFDLVYAALIFEYVEIGAVIRKICGWLDAGGTLVSVLQMPSALAAPVSDTPYSSLKSLTQIMKLVEPECFERLAYEHGLVLCGSSVVPLRLGKSFKVYHHRWQP